MSNRAASRFVLMLVLVASVSAARAQAAGVADPDPARFESDIRAFEAWDRQNAYPRDAVLFVGSSSIRMWQTADSFPDLPIINRGFGGSHTSDVNHFAERIVVKYKPRLVVFYAGDNDIEAGKSPEQVFGDFQMFVHIVHEKLPSTRIVYLPIKPSVARWTMWSKMQAVNAQVTNLARSDHQITVIDIGTPMLGDDGRPRRELFIQDGLHLNEKGYQLWTGIVAPVLHELQSIN